MHQVISKLNELTSVENFGTRVAAIVVPTLSVVFLGTLLSGLGTIRRARKLSNGANPSAKAELAPEVE